MILLISAISVELTHTRHPRQHGHFHQASLHPSLSFRMSESLR